MESIRCGYDLLPVVVSCHENDPLANLTLCLWVNTKEAQPNAATTKVREATFHSRLVCTFAGIKPQSLVVMPQRFYGSGQSMMINSASALDT